MVTGKNHIAMTTSTIAAFKATTDRAFPHSSGKSGVEVRNAPGGHVHTGDVNIESENAQVNFNEIHNLSDEELDARIEAADKKFQRPPAPVKKAKPE